MEYLIYFLAAPFIVLGKCPTGMEEIFTKGFNLSVKCDDQCVPLNSRIPYLGCMWEGFCFQNEYTVYSNDDSCSDCKVPVQITNKPCWAIPINKRHIRSFDEYDNTMYFVGNSRNEDVQKNEISTMESRLNERPRKTTLTPFTTTNATATSTTTADTTTSTAGKITTTTTPTSYTTTTAAPITKSTTPTSPTSSTSKTTTTNLPLMSEGNCENNEYGFKNRCYFLIKPSSIYQNEQNLHNSVVNPTTICQYQQPQSLGLAVESMEEYNFVMKFLRSLFLFDNNTILTSGIKLKDFPGYWSGWNSTVNSSIINCTSNSEEHVMYYTIRPCQGCWNLTVLSESILRKSNNLLMVCERLYNPKNVLPSLYKECLELYRKSKCYDQKKHSRFCCASDETGELWFGCPNESSKKTYADDMECSWLCGYDGIFINEYPDCKAKKYCFAKFNNIKYSAPPRRFARSSCPKYFTGYSTWYCNKNGTFSGTPNYSLCCNFTNGLCKDTDTFLNIWLACTGKKVFKNVTCPPGSINEKAVVEWYCLKNGTFRGKFPDYSNCNKSEIMCVKKDKYGRKWTVQPNVTGKHICPPQTNGFCYWKCNISGEFDTPEPDYSECRPEWINKVSDMIKNGTNHEQVMEVMEDYTKEQDLTIGFNYVLNLTSDCVDLFKKQNSDHKLPVFNKFLVSYSKVFKNIAGNRNVWSNFSVTERRQYASLILKTTQNATFANLGNENYASSQEVYNVTLANSKEDGFDFFVSYNPSINGLKFPLVNNQESDWNLEVKEVNESHSNFAAMGLVMNYSLGSLMFPQENDTLETELNSPVLTFTVATSRSGNPVTIPGVTIQLSFKHINKTRFPRSQIINRKLHKGETPSGVFNSTFCCYYENPNWIRNGCVVTFTSKEETHCTCTHLSTIAILMSLHKYVPNLALETVSLISSGITIISLIITLIVFYVFDTVKNERVLIGKNLCFSLLVGHVLIITVLDKRFFYIPDHLCTVYALVLHYVFVAAFAWMFVEGCHLYRMLVLVFDSYIEYRCIYLLIGYGVPLVVVAVTELIGFAFREQPYGQDELCWLKAPTYIWAFIGPVLLSTSVNFLILIMAMKLAISSKARTEKLNFTNLKIWIKGWFSLSTLLGVTWLLGLAYFHYNEIFVYGFVFFNGLQGFFILLFQCIFNEQYKMIFIQKLKSWFPNCEWKGFKSSDNVKSGTKLIAMTRSSSKWSTEMDAKNFGYKLPVVSQSKNDEDISEGLKKLSLIEDRPSDTPREVGLDIGITLTPSDPNELNRFYVNNFSVQKDKENQNFSRKRASTIWETDDFPELSYHTNYYI